MAVQDVLVIIISKQNPAETENILCKTLHTYIILESLKCKKKKIMKGEEAGFYYCPLYLRNLECLTYRISKFVLEGMCKVMR